MKKKSLKTLRRLAWSACSQYVRQLYSDHRGQTTCYTCGVTGHWKEMQAGHAIPGRNNAVLCNTSIIRVQCATCNIFKRGMHHVFTTRLIKEHSMEWWDQKLIEAKKTVKFNRADYIQLAEDFILKTQQISVDRRAAKWIRTEKP